MAVRRWQIHPDLQLDTEEFGPIPVVSRDTLIEGVMDAVSMLDRSGGVFSVVARRHPTDLPGEMVTVSAIVEWKDRIDAKQQPERQTATVRRSEPDLQAAEEIQEAAGPLIAAGEPDGFDLSALEEEDDSAIPEPQR
jgi:hypothetical protein